MTFVLTLRRQLFEMIVDHHHNKVLNMYLSY